MARVGRMAICVLSLGMLYPNAFAESVDVGSYDGANKAADEAARKK